MEKRILVPLAIIVRRNKEMKRVGICLAGFGNFGKKLYSYLEKIPDCQVKYLYHPDREKARRYGVQGSCDLEKILHDPEVDTFVIATPHDQHASLLKTLLCEKRHHIFVEKPITAFYSDAVLLADLIRANPNVFMVGHKQRKENVFRKAKKCLDQGLIGKVINANFNFSHGGAYNISSTNWRYSLSRHREGPLVTLGSHCIDTIHYLFGPVKSVCATIKNVSGKTEAPDCSTVFMELENGVTVFLQTNYNMPSEKICTIYGTDGIIYINRDEIFLRKGRDKNRVPSKELKLVVNKNDTIEEILQEFFDAIMYGKKVETGYQEGLAVMAVLEACYQSSLKDAKVPL